MSENFERFIKQPNPENQGGTQKQPENEITPGEVEMPEDFIEPEGKSGKWKTEKGEVEIEGKKVEVAYREKVIELTKHRQEESGIQRIRRRELLQPFPDGIVEEKEGEKFFSDDEKFDRTYKFLTDGGYPCEGTWVHTMNYFDPYGIEAADIDKSKREGLYFQEIHCKNKYGFSFWPTRACELTRGFASPVYVFGNTNSAFKEYIRSVLENPEKEWGITKKDIEPETSGELKHLLNRDKLDHYEINLPYFGRFESSKNKPLRWCHAELALMPTKRSLNVLFFETGDEDKVKEK